MRQRMRQESLHLNLHVVQIRALRIVSSLLEDFLEHVLCKTQLGQEASFLSLCFILEGNLKMNTETCNRTILQTRARHNLGKRYQINCLNNFSNIPKGKVISLLF